VILSKRERYIALGTAAAIGLLLLDQFVLTPYQKLRDSVDVDHAKAVNDLAQADLLFSQQRKLRPVWNQILSGGLKTDVSTAESQALRAILDWTRSAGVKLVAVTPERTVQQDQFRVISFSVKISGSMAAVSRLVWAMESATIPVRLTEIRVNSPREGTDDLSAQLSVSTLCLVSETTAQAAAH
jgi:hypothetical protein